MWKIKATTQMQFLTNKEKTKVTNDTLYKYLFRLNKWFVVDHKNKLVGIYTALTEALLKTDDHQNLIVIKELKDANSRHKKAIVKCFCGNVFTARLNDVKRAHTKSCGCMRKRR